MYPRFVCCVPHIIASLLVALSGKSSFSSNGLRMPKLVRRWLSSNYFM